MRKAPFIAKDMSIEARKFLYAAAFWAVAADEELKKEEQEWLVEQFGEEGMTKSLNEFVSLESSRFFEVFDNCARAMSEDDQRRIYPRLEQWLRSCLESDSGLPESEQQVIQKLKDRLQLEDEIGRLSGSNAINAGRSPVQTLSLASGARSSSGGSCETRILSGHTGEVTSVDVSRDGKYVLSGAEDGTVRLWDFETGDAVKVFKGHEAGVGDVRFFLGGRRAVSGDRFGQIRLWNMETGKAEWTSDQKKLGGITGLAVDSEGKSGAFSSDIGMAGVLDLGKGNVVRTFGEKKRGALHDVDISMDGRFVLAGGDDKSLRIWDTASGSERMVFEGHEDGVISVCFSSDGKQVLSGSRDNSVRLWNADTGEELRLFGGHTFSVYSVSFSPDGLRVMSAGWDHTVKIWDARTGVQKISLESLNSRFSSAVFHPGGRHVIAGGSDKAVHVISLVL